MAAEKIDWADKETAQVSPLPVNKKFTSSEANELRDKFNQHAELIDELTTGVNNIETEISELQEQITMDLANRTPIPVTAVDDAPFSIAWQTDLVPNDPYARTYVGRFGNIIQDIINYYEVIGTTMKQSPEFTYTKTGTSINIVTFPANVLQTGTLAIL